MLGRLGKASGNDSLSLALSQKNAPLTAAVSGPFDVQTLASLISGLTGRGSGLVGISHHFFANPRLDFPL